MCIRPFFPVALNLEGRTCVVIGEADDREVTQKAQALKECGAIVRHVHEYSTLRERDVAKTFFVLSAVRDEAFSAHLERLSERHGFLLWCVDQPQFGSISMMAIAKSGPVRVAASTSGVAPSISKAFRKSLERAMDRRFRRFVAELGTLRKRLRERMPQSSQAPERIDAMLSASRDFDVRVSFSYPAWFDQDQDGRESPHDDRPDRTYRIQ
jgi:siroheme synthase (precorrin-2 oxidase/ferrochelatase)